MSRDNWNPFRYPDDDYYRLSQQHAVMEGRSFRLGFRIPVTANGGIANFCMATKLERIAYTRFSLQVLATGTTAATTELKYELFEDVEFDFNTGDAVPLYALNRGINIEVPIERVPVLKLNPTISVEGILAAPAIEIDTPGRSIGNVVDGQISILKPETGYAVRITNLDTAVDHLVDVQATFSFLDRPE